MLGCNFSFAQSNRMSLRNFTHIFQGEAMVNIWKFEESCPTELGIDFSLDQIVGHPFVIFELQIFERRNKKIFGNGLGLFKCY